MVWLWILGGIALVLLALALLPLGVRISYEKELHLALRIGPVKRQVIPAQAREKPPKEEKEPAEKKERKAPLTPAQIYKGLPVLWDALKKALRKTRRRLKIHPLRCSIVFGGDDPSAVAETYGRAETVMWMVMPQLQHLTRMPDPRIHLAVDYNAPDTAFSGEAGLTIRLGDLIVIGLTFGIPALRWYVSATKETAAAKECSQQPLQAEGE